MPILKPMENGTHGRVWYTDKPNNIAFSCFVRSDCSLKQIEGITLKIANLIKEVFQELYDITLEIKLPNDIVYHNKKIGGILVETKVSGNRVKYMVIGIGINTNQEKFNEELQQIASSLYREFNKIIDNHQVMKRFFEMLEQELLERKLFVTKI